MKMQWQPLVLAGLGGVFAVTVAFSTTPTLFAQDQSQAPAQAQRADRGLAPLGWSGMAGWGPHGQSLATIATTLKVSAATLQSALDSGKSIADVATEQKVELNTVIEALIAEQRTALNQAVAGGRLTQVQADAVLANLRENLPELLSLKPLPASVGRPRPGRFGGPAGGKGMMRGLPLATIATTLKVSEADLLAALQGGESVADLADEKGVALDTVVNAVMTDFSAKLKEAVTAGRLTQAQADEQLATFKAQVTAQLQTQGLPGRLGPGPGQRNGAGANPNQTPSQPAPTPTPAPSGSNLNA